MKHGPSLGPSPALPQPAVAWHHHGMAGVLLLLGIAMAGALLAERLPIPYTVLLVVAGVAAGLAGLQPALHLDRDLILQVFLPLLLFQSALQVDTELVRDALPAIVLLAVPGVLLSTVIIAAALTATTNLPWRSAALLGALVSATDPVAVTAVFKRLHAPANLAIVIEGESVLNDATALALFALLLPLAQGGHAGIIQLAVQFVVVLAGGIGIGAAVGWAGGQFTRLYQNHLPELALSAIVAYGSYLLAERVGASGVIAAVAAGLAFSRYSAPNLTQQASELLSDVWEFAAFLANSLLFLLIGVSVRLTALADAGTALLWTVAAALVARLVVVYLCGALLAARRSMLLLRNGFVVFWSGLRGGLAIALALSLPTDFAQRDLFLRITLGVVLFTLLVQGGTLRPLLHRIRPRV